MTNGFIDTGVDYDEVSRLAIVRAEDLNALGSAVVAAFNKVPSEARIKEGRITYCGATAGTANAQTASAPYTMTATDGATIRVKWGFTNTAALTLTMAVFGTLAVTDYGGSALTGGEAAAGTFAELTYHGDSNHWRISNPQVAVANVTNFDITALSTGTSVDATADYVPIYSVSAGGQRKVLAGLISDEYQNILKSQLFAGAA